MNRKSLIILICWVTLCVGLVVFMIVHIIIQQNLALAKEAQNVIALYTSFFGGMKI